MNDEMGRLLAEAVDRVKRMTPEERQEMHQAQLASYVRAEAAFGSDADEREYCEALASGDPRRLEAAKFAEAARVQVAEAYLKERGLA